MPETKALTPMEQLKIQAEQIFDQAESFGLTDEDVDGSIRFSDDNQQLEISKDPGKNFWISGPTDTGEGVTSYAVMLSENGQVIDLRKNDDKVIDLTDRQDAAVVLTGLLNKINLIRRSA